MKKATGWSLLAGLALMLGCAPQAPEETPPADTEAPAPATAETAAAPSDLSGSIKVDGSSTVYPITEAVAEEFKKSNPNVDVSVGFSGTGGGFKKFIAKETDISDASRPIKSSEAEQCAAAGVEFIELPVAFDGLSVMVNPANDWCDSLTVDELKKIWEPSSTINNWKDVRAGFPDVPLKLYGAGTDSGTFDYFTEAINGEEGAARSDFTPSEDDNVLVQGIAGDKGSLGFFGYAYYVENKDQLKLVAIDPGDGKPVAPDATTIMDGSYKPLARPIFIYVSKSAADSKPELDAFVDFYLTNAEKLVAEVGYVPLTADHYTRGHAKYEARKAGTVFSGSTVGVTIDDLVKAE